MNIFELTRILNEAKSEIGDRLIKNVEEFDTKVELEGSQEEKESKNKFFIRVSREIEDAAGNNENREKIKNFIKTKWLPKSSSYLEHFEVVIGHFLRNLVDDDLQLMVNCISGNPLEITESSNKGNIFRMFKDKESVK